jgi:hypothetical protein
MIDISSRAERLRMAMRVVRQKVRAGGTLKTDRDVLDWLKFARSETTGIKLGFSRGEVAEMDAQIDAAWRESVEAEVNRRLAERDATIDVHKPTEASDRSQLVEMPTISYPSTLGGPSAMSLNELMQWVSFVRDVGLILGVPVLIGIGVKLLQPAN